MGNVVPAFLLYAVALPAAQDAPPLSVAPRPTVRFGLRAEEALVRVPDATRLPDGTVIAVDEGASVLRAFSEDGARTWEIGGPGGGPGEFARPVSVQRAGDTLMVFDRSNRRVSMFSAAGELIDEIPMATPFAAETVQRFADGRWFLQEIPRFAATTPGRVPRDSIRLFVTDERTGAPVLAAEVPGPTSLTFEMAGRRLRRFAPFWPAVRSAVYGTCVYVTNGTDPFVTVLDGRGRSVGRIVFDRPGREVTEELRARYIARHAAIGPEELQPAFRRAA